MPEPNRPVLESTRASQALSALPPDSNFVVRLLLSRVRQGVVFNTVTGLAAQLGQARQGLAIVQAACGIKATEEIDEIALAAPLSFGAQGPRIDPKEATLAIELAEPERAISCLRNFLPVSETEVAGAPALVLPNGGHVQARGSLLLYASGPHLEGARTRIDDSAPLGPGVRAVLDQNPSAMLIAYSNAQNPYDLEWASLVADDSKGDVKIEAVAVARSKEAADQAASQLVQALERAKQELQQYSSGAESAELETLLDTVRVDVRDKSLSARLVIPEKDAEHFFSKVLVTVIAENSRRYALAMRAAEARDLVMQIALKLSDYAKAHANRFPPSAPLSPDKVPQRAPVLPASHFEHPSWKAIGFAPHEPIFFSYEFVTAKNGRSVEVIARGDLDADGQTSKYSTTVRVRKGEVTTSPTIQEENPFE